MRLRNGIALSFLTGLLLAASHHSLTGSTAPGEFVAIGVVSGVLVALVLWHEGGRE